MCLFVVAVKIGNPNIPFVDMLSYDNISDGDISDASSQSEMINPEILEMSLIVVRHSSIDFIEIIKVLKFWRSPSKDAEEFEYPMETEEPEMCMVGEEEVVSSRIDVIEISCSFSFSELHMQNPEDCG